MKSRSVGGLVTCSRTRPQGPQLVEQVRVHPAEESEEVVVGVLPLGQGSRSLFADTTELHQKLDKMHTRIRALEEALAVSYSQHSSNNHPLLGSDLLDIKNYASTGESIKSEDGEGIHGRNGKET